MVGSLMLADQILQAEESIISYSDIIYPGTGVSSLARSNFEIAVLYSTNWLDIWRLRFSEPLLDAESFKTGLNGAITEIGLPIEDINVIEGQYMGLIKFQPSGWEKAKMIIQELEPEMASKISMTELLQKVLIRFPQTVFGVPFSGTWWEFDSQSDIKAFESSKFVSDFD
jgi:choline kinase